MNIELYRHKHHFNQHKPKAGEKRTWWVILLTTVTMAGEIIAGLLFGSMALLADGLHMASHAAALGITAFAYIYARRHAHDVDARCLHLGCLGRYRERGRFG